MAAHRGKSLPKTRRDRCGERPEVEDELARERCQIEHDHDRREQSQSEEDRDPCRGEERRSRHHRAVALRPLSHPEAFAGSESNYRCMAYVMQAVPLLVVAVIVALILRSSLRGRLSWRLPSRPQRPKRSRLRDVSRDRMDDELQNLLRKR